MRRKDASSLKFFLSFEPQSPFTEGSANRVASPGLTVEAQTNRTIGKLTVGGPQLGKRVQVHFILQECGTV